MQKSDLPIFEIEHSILATLRTHKRLVLSAPTGSGKSTQVPQMLLDGGLLGDGQVTILQPRRLPTRMLANWVAQARKVKLGGEVGYQMRFDSVTSSATRISYVTEGVLLRRMLADPKLKGVTALIFDEFHERHLYGDITLARSLELQQAFRPDLIIIVMSATLDVAALEKYLQPCAALSSHGRAHAVTIEYLSTPAGKTPVWKLALQELRRVLPHHTEGDVLIFMPGTYEIARTVQEAQESLGQKFAVFPLHGELTPKDQDAAVAHHDRRKIVVATNVAESSVTIDGVRLVIDSGLARIPRYDPYRAINTLLIEKISRAAADQRAGRAGRTAPGHCLRLWTAHEHHARAAHDIPEVKRLDLAEVILTLKASGINDLQTFHWLESPDRHAIERAETLLIDLGAVDQKTGAITDIGRRMLRFPLHPRYARMLLAAAQYDCVYAVGLIAALTQGRDLLRRREIPVRENFISEQTASDFFVLLRAWEEAERSGFNVEYCHRIGINTQAARQVKSVFEQFLKIAAEEGLDSRKKPLDYEGVRRCVLVGFSDHLAKRLNGSPRCELVHNRRGSLARDSVVKAPLFVASEIREIESGSGRERNLNVVLNLATAVKQEWLRELFPAEFSEFRSIVYDPALKRVVARKETRFRDLVLEEKLDDDVPPDEAGRILAREIIAGRLTLENWNEAVEQWILRVNRLGEWMPNLKLPVIGSEERATIIEHICHGAASYNEVHNRPVLPVVKSWLSHEQQTGIEQYAPERIQLPGGRLVKIVYAADAPPLIAARIQDLYGIKEGLSIARRRVAVRIQVLAPSNRPVQVTENLALFWRETYPKLKQQLQRRYPKHEWR